jgi:RNase H-fold protein (predicted Holliday junction resolvase)
METEKKVIAIDPGNYKCGIAVVDQKKNVYLKKVIEKENLKEEIKNILEIYNINLIILGNKTSFKEVEKILKNFKNIKIVLQDESFSTIKARKRYFKEKPPSGIRKLLPVSFQIPPEPYDDYAAIILAEEYFAKSVSK